MTAELRKELDELREQNRNLLAENSRMKAAMTEKGLPEPDQMFGAAGTADDPPLDYSMAELLYPEIKARLIADLGTDAELLQALTSKPEIEVRVERKKCVLEEGTVKGAVAKLIVEGFFDTPRNQTDVYQELYRRGSCANPRECSDVMKELAAGGFLTREKLGYQAAPGVQANIVEEA